MADNELVLRFGTGEKEIEITLLSEQEKFGIIGVIAGKMLPGWVAIRVDELMNDDREFDVGALQKSRQCPYAVICLEPIILKGLRTGDALSLLTVFHELGHFVHGHASLRTDGSSEYDEKRKALIRQGKAQSDELEADAFAVEYLGVNIVIAGLNKLRQYMLKRYQTDAWDQEDVDLMNREIEIREKILIERDEENV